MEGNHIYRKPVKPLKKPYIFKLITSSLLSIAGGKIWMVSLALHFITQPVV